ncbi:MAG: hypothetical protein MAG715_00780 [Methanonatronarchaeales archaeon]|nr:hypothetical protein [Methanonatronarchaeales archaeon]
MGVTHVINLKVDALVSVTLSVPEEMKEKMDRFPEINWSEVARQSIDEKLRDLQFLEEFKERSELSERDAVELGREVNEALAERYGE